jgi:thiamine-monophosphate kinase
LPPHPRVPLGFGDDAALLEARPGWRTVVTTDMLMDGVDFIVGEHALPRIGRKALAVNLSDLAAMGAEPLAAFVSLALPRSGGLELAQSLYEGILPLAAEFQLTIAGGDTNSWDGPLVINVTAIGECQENRELRRGGALPGEAILVTGDFGGSLLGKQFDFTPRVREARWLVEHCQIHAALDVSDGLSLDLSRLASASGCGAALDLGGIPIAAAAHVFPDSRKDGRTALDHALSDGEDFELILAVPPEQAEELLRSQPLEVPLTKIGTFVTEPGLWSQQADGTRVPLVPRGYEH